MRPVRDVRYQALGAEPFWLLAIGDDRIVLRPASRPRTAKRVWPRTLPRTAGKASASGSPGDGAQVITVEARPGPCDDRASSVYEDHVRVRLSRPRAQRLRRPAAARRRARLMSILSDKWIREQARATRHDRAVRRIAAPRGLHQLRPLLLRL